MRRPAPERGRPRLRPLGPAGPPGWPRPGRTRRTTRLAILGLIALALVVAIAPTLRVYLHQRAQISALETKQAQQRQDVAALQAQAQRWNDPAYIEAQARSRLQFVKPGQRSYVVSAPKPAAATAPGQRHRGGDDRLGQPVLDGRPVAVPAEGRREPVPRRSERRRRLALSADDLLAVREQLGREPRGAVRVAHRCACGDPDVVETAPRLPDGTPFPTTYYVTCPRLTGRISTLEGAGVMAEMTAELSADPVLAQTYSDGARGLPCPAGAPRRGAGDRRRLGRRACRTGSSACTSWSVIRSRPGPGVNPLGDATLAALAAGGAWWDPPCRRAAEESRMTKVAAIDCGTNSIRLLVAEIDSAAGTLHDLDRRMEIVRLGQDVDRTGMLADEALARTFAAAEGYAAACADHGVERIRFVATSATRDAGNRAVFVDGIRERLGVEPEVVSGAEEAALSFSGATRELSAVGAAAPYLVVDIGGGSTEVVRGS